VSKFEFLFGGDKGIRTPGLLNAIQESQFLTFFYSGH